MVSIKADLKNFQSKGAAEHKKELLKQIFPSCFKEDGTIRWDALKKELQSERLLEPSEEKEFYHLNWHGKTKAMQILKDRVANRVFNPKLATSLNFEESKNVLITGDNLEALKLLQNHYHHSIKCIYIDPPYNTGNDFIYNDDYRTSQAQHKQDVGTIDAFGNLLSSEDLAKSNTHSNWLSMMYPRLVLARGLLKDDGVIFISIDDNEQANLKLLCDEVFGEENFVAELVWRKTGQQQNNGHHFAISHEYILVYAKNKQSCIINKESIFKREGIKQYSYKDEKGAYRLNPIQHGTLGAKYFSVIHPISKKKIESNKSLKSTEEILELDKQGLIYWGSGNNSTLPQVKKYLDDHKGVVANGIIDKYYNESSNKTIKELFGEQVFDYSKPYELISYLISLSSSAQNNDIILDFFAGSGTTGQAVMELNKADGGNRKFILVQIDEELDEKSEAYKQGFKTIDEITMARLSKVANKLEKSENLLNDNIRENKLDLGYKHFKIEDSNFAKFEIKMANPQGFKDAMEDFIENQNKIYGCKEEELIWEIMQSHFNFGLDVVYKKVNLVGIDLISIEHLEEYILLYISKQSLDDETLDKLIALKPSQILLVEDAFVDDNQKQNFIISANAYGVIFKSI